MFSITGLGAGVDTFVVSSATAADRVIDTFENAIKAGYNPNDISEQVFEKCQVDIARDLTEFDKNRIKMTVEEIYRMESMRRY